MQKLVGTELYVFDLTPFEITEQTADATVVYVQLECIDGYKELNPSLADIMEPFNQWLNCVKAPWKDGVEPTPVTGHTLTLSGTDIHGHIEVYLDGVQQEVSESYSDVEADTAIKIVPTEDHEDYTLVSGAEWDSEQNAWVATMPDENLTIEINYTEPPVTHTVTLSGTDLSGDVVTVKVNSETVAFANSYTVNDNETLEIFLSEDPSCYELASENMNYSTEGGAHYWITVDSDLAVVLNYTAAPAGSYNIVLSGTGVHSDTAICGYENGDVTWITGTWDSTNNTVTIEYPAGQPFQIDERYITIDSISPQLQESQDPLWGIGTSYVMPSANVAISLSSKYQVSFTSDSNAQAEITINPEWAAENETVEITFNNGSTTQDVTVTSTDATLVYDSQNDKYTFTMPAQNVEIKAVYTNPVVYTLTNNLVDTNVGPWFEEQTVTRGSGMQFAMWIEAEGKTKADFTITATNATITPDADPDSLLWAITGTVDDTIVVSEAAPL